MACLAFVYIGLGLFEDHPGGFLNAKTVVPLELTISAIFLAEFSLRLWAAESRSAYLRRHWIDLLALLPAIRYLRFLRLGRLVYVLQAARLLRLGMLIRFLVDSDRALSRIGGIATRNGVHVILLSALGLVIVGGSLVWEIEHAANRSFSTFGDAIWWAFATMTTVGNGSAPVTVPGRIIGGAIMVIGICCFGLVTATVTAYFVQHHEGHRQATPNEIMAALEEIQRRLEQLERGAPVGLKDYQE